jgi:hypothetical protein
VRTHATRVEVELGPYRVVGLVHGTRASDLRTSALRRAPWLPLTEATVTYRLGPDSVSDDVATLVVNRSVASSFRALEEAGVALPWEEPRMPRLATPRAIDLTGTLRDEVPPDRDEPEPSRESGPIL